MRKILLTCCLLLGIAAVSRAQGGMRMSPDDRAKAMQTQYKLTDDQTAKIVVILKNMAAKRDSLRNAGADRSAMMPLMQTMAMQIKAILTADQWTAYQKAEADRRAQMQQGGGGGN
jgi:protein CpxP